MKIKKNSLSLFIILSFLTISCGTPSTLTPIADTPNNIYQGTATILIAVEGTDEREVRHIEIGTQEEEGYEIYFHHKKVGEGFIILKIPTPSTNVYISEYSLTGMYGCSRGKDGYGRGVNRIPRIVEGKIYFIGTINTSMNTTYKEMPKKLIKESKEKYHYNYIEDDVKKKNSLFKSHITL